MREKEVAEVIWRDNCLTVKVSTLKKIANHHSLVTSPARLTERELIQPHGRACRQSLPGPPLVQGQPDAQPAAWQGDSSCPDQPLPGAVSQTTPLQTTRPRFIQPHLAGDLQHSALSAALTSVEKRQSGVLGNCNIFHRGCALAALTPLR
jgi:hypothetical protein